jgi:hypothetical protein
MEIFLNSKEKITTDENNWIYSLKQKNTWESKFYYPSLQSCYTDLLDYFIRLSDKKKLMDALEESVKKLEILKKEAKC